jgi:hypothetical protein
MSTYEGGGTVEINERGHIVITPSSAIKGATKFKLKATTASCNIRATLLIDVLYNCSVCGANNMNYETSEFHKQTLEHLMLLQKQLECYEKVTECEEEEDSTLSLFSYSPQQVLSSEDENKQDNKPTEDDERTVTEGCEADDVGFDTAIDDEPLSTPQQVSRVVEIPSAPIKLKRKFSVEEESDMSNDEESESACTLYKPMARDGNCFFRSLADQIYGDEMYHLLIRQVCYYFWKKHPELGYCEIETNKILKDDRCFEFGRWGGEDEAKIISEIYHFRIETIDKDTKAVKQIVGQDNWATLKVIYTPEHYDSFVSNSSGNFSDKFTQFHYNNPGSFENEIFQKEGICVKLPEINRNQYSSVFLQGMPRFKVNPKAFGEKFRGNYIATVEDTAFGSWNIISCGKDFLRFHGKRLLGDDYIDSIYYKLRFEDGDVAWCSKTYLLDLKTVREQPKRRKRRRMY